MPASIALRHWFGYSGADFELSARSGSGPLADSSGPLDPVDLRTRIAGSNGGAVSAGRFSPY